MIPPLKRPVVVRGMRGRDVLGLKRELHRAGQAGKAFDPLSASFGAGMEIAVRHFQAAHRLVVDGQIGPITHSKLWPYGDRYAHWLVTGIGGDPHPRKRLVAELRYLVSVHGQIGYAQSRPIPLKKILDHDWPVFTDCSGCVTAAFYAAGFPDPNGLHYNGLGYTGTLLSHLSHIPRSMVKPGDLAVFGYFPGDHVVAFIDTEPSDPTVFSHGHAGSPDDPGAYAFSRFTAYFGPSFPITYLSAL